MECQTCGTPYNDSFADWSICRSCMWQQEQSRGVVYIDSLGISWTQEELDGAGGLQEVVRLNHEAKV
jgi:hypothetical protein